MTTPLLPVSDANQPDAAFKALEQLVDQTIGIKLFTLMELDYERGVSCRNYSNQPEVYPATGEKPMQNNEWTEKVQKRQETFVANSIEDIAKVFFDHELIESLGCGSVVNIPIVVAGTTIGTLNCLHETGHYTPERVAASESLKSAGALAFLLDSYTKRTNHK